MSTPTIFYFIARFPRAHPKAMRWLAGTVLAWVGLCFALGYRLPGRDRHPDWPYFPQTTNPRLVVEPIPDSVFERRYRARFPDPPSEPVLEGRGPAVMRAYRARLPNLRSLGFQTTENRFDTDINWSFGWHYTNQTFDRDTTWQPRFHHLGYEYLELHLGDQVGRFKSRANDGLTDLFLFYQYNTFQKERDTLFIRYLHHDFINFKIFLR